LCDETNSAPFQRPEWITAYIRSFEPQSEVILTTAYEDGRLTAVLPLVRKRSFCAGVPVVKLTGTANSHSIQFDILRVPGPIGAQSTHAIWKSLECTNGWDVLELPMFAPGGGCSELVTLARLSGYPTVALLIQNSPILRLRLNTDGRPAEIVGGPSRHFRHELRRYARIFGEQTGEKPTVTRSVDPSDVLLRQFFDLEASGRKGREGSAIKCELETRSFYEEIAKVGNRNGYFCLHSLARKGKMVAGAFSVFTDSCFYPMKIAHDESLRRSAPGHLLFNAIVAECAENQIPDLFFGGTDERFKAMWTQERVPLFRTFIFSSRLRARLAYHLRKSVLTPLGKLRWTVKTHLKREHIAKRRRTDSVIAPEKNGVEKHVSSVQE
jgi:CelD/BcsL family acetyltransferase involved in cellulose biosynthesis